MQFLLHFQCYVMLLALHCCCCYCWCFVQYFMLQEKYVLYSIHFSRPRNTLAGCLSVCLPMAGEVFDGLYGKMEILCDTGIKVESCLFIKNKQTNNNNNNNLTTFKISRKKNLNNNYIL